MMYNVKKQKNNSTQYKLHGIGQWSKNVIK